jgi:hypothetical protein
VLADVEGGALYSVHGAGGRRRGCTVLCTRVLADVEGGALHSVHGASGRRRGCTVLCTRC